jgi:hypothetical protein
MNVTILNWRLAINPTPPHSLFNLNIYFARGVEHDKNHNTLELCLPLFALWAHEFCLYVVTDHKLGFHFLFLYVCFLLFICLGFFLFSFLFCLLNFLKVFL